MRWVLHTSQADISPGRAFWRAVAVPLALLNALVAVGTIGYIAIEGWSWLDALWMAVITLTTIGFGEIHPLSDAGRLFTLAYILIGLGVFTRGIASAARYVADGELTRSVVARRHRQEMSRMEQHYVVVGYGRLGREVVDDLRAQGAPIVVIDLKAPENPVHGVRYIVGDATQDETLHEAAIGRARGVAIATPNDAINVFVTLSIRQLAPDLPIHTRAEDERTARKAMRAGATGVLLPFQIGGRRMAHALLRPGSTAFVEHLTSAAVRDIGLEDIIIEAGAPACGRTLRELDPRARWRVLVAATRPAGSQTVALPDPDTALQAGDMLIAIGHPEDVARFVEEGCTVTGRLPSRPQPPTP